MAGKECVKCGNLTVFKKDDNKYECSKCGYSYIVPNDDLSQLGRGKLCPVCKNWTVHNHKCSYCGTVITSE